MKSSYFRLVIALTLTISIASFIRDRGQLASNISLWLFLVPFAATLWRTQIGFLSAVLMLTVSPGLHVQLNVLAGTSFHAWAYPGVDCCLGFLAAWVLKGGLNGADEVLARFPSGPLLFFHAWMSLSAVLAVARNIWQSASEFTVRGLAYNLWLTRGISWHDDFYPLQDPFFYSVAAAMLFSTWALMQEYGDRTLKRLFAVVLAGATANVVFALWQKETGKGWVNGEVATSINAFWPDLHSFAVFMALVLFLAYGCLVRLSANSVIKTLSGVALLAAATGLYLSGSRSTLFFVSVALLIWAGWAMLRLRGWRRVFPLIAALAVVVAVHWTLDQGYRGLSYATLHQRLTELTPKSLSDVLSYRPEIWAATFRMYLKFPFFGLGQGAFYRQSAIREFSQSEFLVSMGGEGVHNELLRILVELGPVGLTLLIFASIPFFKLGRKNLRWASFYALLGLAVGNMYTNALLVRELLLLSAVFAGSFIWEAQSGGAPWWRPPEGTTVRRATVVLGFLAMAALIEVIWSFGRFPFTYGQRCKEVLPLSNDGWTQGVVRIPMPPAVTRAEVLVLADRPDLPRRPLDLDVSFLSGSGKSLAIERHTFVQRASEPKRIELQVPESPDGKRFLELKPSHCFVPLNLGITYDPRRLGVHLTETRLFTATGVEAR